jgi:hypothetical protein
LRVAGFGGFVAEQALEQGLQTLVIESLREYNTLKKLYDVMGTALYVLNVLNAL